MADHGAMNIGNAIKTARIAVRMTQLELARACGWESQARVSNYEKGTREPTLGDLERIAKATRTSLLDLLARAAGVSLPTDTAGASLTPDEEVLLSGYRTANPRTQEAILTLLNNAAAQAVPQLAPYIGKVDLSRQKSVEPKLEAGQRLARKKDLTTTKSKKPSKGGSP